MNDAKPLSGQVALVTGAGRGIGAAIAVRLAKMGTSVVLCARTEKTLQKVAAEITAQGGKASAIQCDVSDLKSVEALARHVEQEHRRLDILVNNAGVGSFSGPLHEMTPDAWEKILNTNLRGVFYCIRAFAPTMIRQGGGHIINISSVHEDWPMPGNIAYCCAKGGVRMLTRTAGVELGPKGITVVNVGPGAVDTPIDAKTLADPAQKAKLDAAIPIGHVAEPNEIANLVVWLASDQARYGTATTYFIDGGIMQGSVGL